MCIVNRKGDMYTKCMHLQICIMNTDNCFSLMPLGGNAAQSVAVKLETWPTQSTKISWIYFFRLNCLETEVKTEKPSDAQSGTNDEIRWIAGSEFFVLMTVNIYSRFFMVNQ